MNDDCMMIYTPPSHSALYLIWAPHQYLVKYLLKQAFYSDKPPPLKGSQGALLMWSLHSNALNIGQRSEAAF